MSQLPSDLPQLPKLPFLVADGVLVFVAIVVAATQEGPLVGWPLAAVLICVLLAALLAAIPFVTDYARGQDLALDERQRSLLSLGRTLDQCSERLERGLGAVAGLEEQLRSQFSQLNDVGDRVRATVEASVLDVNASKDAQIAALSSQLKALSDERAASHKVSIDKLQVLVDALAHTLETQTAAFSQAQARLTEATQTSLSKADAVAGGMLAAASALDQHLAKTQSAFAQLQEGFRLRMDSVLAQTLQKSTEHLEKTSESVLSQESHLATAMQARLERAAGAFEEALAASRRNQDTLLAATSAALIEFQEVAGAALLKAQSMGLTQPASPSSVADVASHPEAPVVAPAVPDSGALESQPPSTPELHTPVEQTAQDSEVSTSEPPTSGAQGSVPTPSASVPAPVVLDLFSEEFSLEAHYEQPLVTRAHSVDGATRVLVTSYLGKGHHLYIRGGAAGLSWTKGEAMRPMGFGKWIWESLELENTLSFKLYKNDQVEAKALGEVSVEPGQQAELIAAF